jgi:hypothetical protein
MTTPLPRPFADPPTLACIAVACDRNIQARVLSWGA